MQNIVILKGGVVFTLEIKEMLELSVQDVKSNVRGI